MGLLNSAEYPQHTVTLSAFTIDRFEVTNEKYQSCVQAGCCEPPTYNGSYTGREHYYGSVDFYDYPVIFVTWEMAAQYCAGLDKRLPTEAEWEYAARGDDGRTFPWGSDSPSVTEANFGGAQDGDTEAVGSYVDGASPFGAEDMAGNVWEWVADWYDRDYYNQSPANDPPGPATGLMRVARGGSFASEPDTLYSYYRMHYVPSESFATLGFRCAR
jgi:formylglycine-generating enzyme required for sulfatase activity